MPQEVNLLSPRHESHEAEEAPVKKKKKTGCYILSTLILLFVVAHAYGVVMIVVGGAQVRGAIREISLEQAVDPVELQVISKEIREGLHTVQSGLGVFFWTRPIPVVGEHYTALYLGTRAGIESLGAVEELLVILEDSFRAINEGRDASGSFDITAEDAAYLAASDEAREEFLRSLSHAAPQLEAAQIHLASASEDLYKITELNLLPEIRSAVDIAYDIMQDVLHGTEILIPIAGSLDTIAGIDDPSDWLILFLNDTELRPGGGFLGVYGLTTINNGLIISLDTSDTYSVDVFVTNEEGYHVNPPDPIREFIGSDNWYFRDANWSPDFKKSAQDATQLLRQETSYAGLPVPDPDGVIGFSTQFVASLLSVTGPIELGGNIYTDKNLAELLEFEVEYGFVDQGIAFDARKDIIDELAQIMVEKLFSLDDPSQYSELFNRVLSGFAEKQIALYSAHEEAQLMYEDAGWAGIIDADAADDTLFIADANLAALKTDPSVQREITYSVEPYVDPQTGEGTYLATASATYVHNGRFDTFTTRYRTYTRFYAPHGSTFVDLEGSLQNDPLFNPGLREDEVTIQDELGLTSFGAFTSIEPGETRTLTVRYIVSPSVRNAIDAGIYELQILKQIGSQKHTLTLDLDFGKKVRSASPSESSEQFGDQAYTIHAVLDENKSFTVEF
jgi:hypothetical protein